MGRKRRWDGGHDRAGHGGPVHILDLPDEVFENILSKTGRLPCDAERRCQSNPKCGDSLRIIAQTHTRLYRLCRQVWSNVLTARQKHVAGAIPAPGMSRRVPRMKSCVVRLRWQGEEYDRDVGGMGSDQLRVFELGRAAWVPNRPRFTGVVDLVENSPGLEKVKVEGLRGTFTNAVLAALVEVNPRGLRDLSLSGCTGPGLSDEAGSMLSRLSGLRSLDLALCSALGGHTFDGVGKLQFLVDLCLDGTRFNTHDAIRLLPGMHALRHLDVSRCRLISADIWTVLPPNLRVFRAVSAPIFDGAGALVSPITVHGSLQYIDIAFAYRSAFNCMGWRTQGGQANAEFQTASLWEVLASSFATVRKLSLEGCRLGDDGGVADALPRLRHLESLVLHGNMSIDFKAFQAIAWLPNLAVLDVADTMFGTRDALQTLPRLKSLRRLDVSQCVGVDSGIWAALPQGLLELEALGTTILGVATPAPGRGLRRSPLRGGPGQTGPGDTGVGVIGHHGLRRLGAGCSHICDWGVFTCGFRSLQSLDLTGTPSLGSNRVSAALWAMPALQDLDVTDCELIGDETAFALARHAKLRRAVVLNTALSAAGWRVLKEWETGGRSSGSISIGSSSSSDSSGSSGSGGSSGSSKGNSDRIRHGQRRRLHY